MTHDQLLRVPKLCGGDIELGNFVTGLDGVGPSGAVASRALLAEIDGVGDRRYAGVTPLPSATAEPAPRHIDPYDPYGASGLPATSPDASDWGRKFLPTNGGCAYIDLDHLELCLPEVRSASDHVACWHAMLRLAQQAMASANARLPDGQRIHAHANNSDGQSQSYGGHLNVLISRRAWDNIFHEKLHYLLYLASFLVSSMVYSGQGKVGSENGRPAAPYQLSQRADFLETVMGPQTTYWRPIVNSRDEPLTGIGLQRGGGQLARLHVISLDTTLCHVASLLRVGALQIVLAMIEAEETFAQDLVLDDPVGAVVRWSHDPTLEHRERTVPGRLVTAVEHQLMFLEAAKAFGQRQGCDGFVPGAPRILGLWEDTLLKLRRRDFDALTHRLDWVLKRSFLERAMASRPGLDWAAPQAKFLDHLFSSLDRSAGLYWAAERDGLVTRVVTEDEIERFTRWPPENTRAWTRAMVLRAVGDRVDHVDWDQIRIRTGNGPWAPTQTIDLSDPLGSTREWYDEVVRRSGAPEAAVGRPSDPTPDATYH